MAMSAYKRTRPSLSRGRYWLCIYSTGITKPDFQWILRTHFLQWAHSFRLGIATKRPWGPPINFKSRMTNAPSMVIEQKAISLSAVFSTSLILTSVISMAFPHWPYHHHPHVSITSCYSKITKSDNQVTQARAEWQLHKAIQQLRDS